MSTSEEIEKYNTDKMRCEKLAELLRKRIKILGRSRGDISSELEDKINFPSASTFVNMVMGNNRGKSAQKFSSVVTLRRGGSTLDVDYLGRLASLYEVLEIDARDPIIDITKEINPNFKYPLTL